MNDNGPAEAAIHFCLGFGGNLGDVRGHFTDALKVLAADPRCRGDRIRCSRLYKTQPWGLSNQPDFFNLCVSIEWLGSPEDLQKLTLELERRAGRDRHETVRWGPRPLDIDLLFACDREYQPLQIDRPGLTIPHPRLALRRFVLVPLMDLLPPSTVLPPWQATLRELFDRCPDMGQVTPVTGGEWKEWK